jgi:hypothetical protein
MRTLSFRSMLLAALALTLAASFTPDSRGQDVLVDTGQGSASGGYSLFHDGTNFNFLGGKFTLGEPFTIGTVQVWMVRPTGTLAIKLRANSGSNLPGAELASANFPVTFAGFSAQWTTFSGMNWSQPAGTYWITVEPAVGTTGGSMPGNVPNPLPATAFLTNGNPTWVLNSPGDALGRFGIRLLTPAPPDPIDVPGDFPTIQLAIDAALPGQIIEVAPGTYNEAINFSGKTIVVRTADERGVATIDATGTNLPAVQIPAGSAAGTRLEGFTITGGSALTGLAEGGGVLVSGATATIADCIITNNEADSGGGAAIVFASNATFEDCTLSANDADTLGGGAYINGANATFTNCAFSANTSDADGGGMNVNNNGVATLTGCTFTGNSSDNAGGGAMIISGTADATFTACTFQDNSAVQAGGVALNLATAEFTDCDFINNSATFNGTTAGGGMQVQGSATLTLTSCTFTGNDAAFGGGVQFLVFPGSATLTGCAFEDNDASIEGGAIHSGFGGTPIVEDSTFCGNAPNHIVGSWTNGGGNQFNIACNAQPGDTNGDGQVNVDDLVSVILGWGSCPNPPANCPADVNNDGMVDVDDLVMVILNWG